MAVYPAGMTVEASLAQKAEIFAGRPLSLIPASLHALIRVSTFHLVSPTLQWSENIVTKLEARSDGEAHPQRISQPSEQWVGFSIEPSHITICDEPFLIHYSAVICALQM
jgi:hypothetical protein